MSSLFINGLTIAVLVFFAAMALYPLMLVKTKKAVVIRKVDRSNNLSSTPRDNLTDEFEILKRRRLENIRSLDQGI